MIRLFPKNTLSRTRRLFLLPDESQLILELFFEIIQALHHGWRRGMRGPTLLQVGNLVLQCPDPSGVSCFLFSLAIWFAHYSRSNLIEFPDCTVWTGGYADPAVAAVVQVQIGLFAGIDLDDRLQTASPGCRAARAGLAGLRVNVQCARSFHDQPRLGDPPGRAFRIRETSIPPRIAQTSMGRWWVAVESKRTWDADGISSSPCQ